MGIPLFILMLSLGAHAESEEESACSYKSPASDVVVHQAAEEIAKFKGRRGGEALTKGLHRVLKTAYRGAIPEYEAINGSSMPNEYHFQYTGNDLNWPSKLERVGARLVLRQRFEAVSERGISQSFSEVFMGCGQLVDPVVRLIETETERKETVTAVELTGSGTFETRENVSINHRMYYWRKQEAERYAGIWMDNAKTLLSYSKDAPWPENNFNGYEDAAAPFKYDSDWVTLSSKPSSIPLTKVGQELYELFVERCQEEGFSARFSSAARAYTQLAIVSDAVKSCAFHARASKEKSRAASDIMVLETEGVDRITYGNRVTPENSALGSMDGEALLRARNIYEKRIQREVLKSLEGSNKQTMFLAWARLIHAAL